MSNYITQKLLKNKFLKDIKLSKDNKKFIFIEFIRENKSETIESLEIDGEEVIENDEDTLSIPQTELKMKEYDTSDLDEFIEKYYIVNYRNLNDGKKLPIVIIKENFDENELYI